MLWRLYLGTKPRQPIVNDFTPLIDRNAEIYRRYLAGERAVDMADEYGVVLQQIYNVIRQQKQYNNQR